MRNIHRPSHDPFIIDRLDSQQMNRPRAHFGRTLRFATLCCAAVALCMGFGSGYGYASFGSSGGNTNAATGTYVVKIAGYYTGNGQASVGTGIVHITGNVTDITGATGLLRADVQLASTHFNGTGTVFGAPMTIDGRVDAADTKRGVHNQVQIGPRIVATFTSSSGHRGRVFGQPDHSVRPD